MDKPMPDLMFIVMSRILGFRDIFTSAEKRLKEVGVKPGQCVLDYGCGPGSYSICAAQMVEKSGKVYALDIHRLAVQRVQETASKMGLTNIETICSNCATGLPDKTIDIVLLYGVSHLFSDPYRVFAELRRVLKPTGILSFYNPHVRKNRIISHMTQGEFFRYLEKSKRAYRFAVTGYGFTGSRVQDSLKS